MEILHVLSNIMEFEYSSIQLLTYPTTTELHKWARWPHQSSWFYSTELRIFSQVWFDLVYFNPMVKPDVLKLAATLHVQMSRRCC